MHTVKLYEWENDALRDFVPHAQRPGVVIVQVTSHSSFYLEHYECQRALLTLANGTAVHMIAGTEPTILPRFDVAWFDGVGPPEWVGDMAKPGAVVLLSRQPKEGSGAA